MEDTLLSWGGCSNQTGLVCGCGDSSTDIDQRIKSLVWKQGWGTDQHEALFPQTKSYVKRVPPQNATGWGQSVQTDESGDGGGNISHSNCSTNNLNSQAPHSPPFFLG